MAVFKSLLKAIFCYLQLLLLFLTTTIIIITITIQCIVNNTNYEIQYKSKLQEIQEKVTLWYIVTKHKVTLWDVMLQLWKNNVASGRYKVVEA